MSDLSKRLLAWANDPLVCKSLEADLLAAAEALEAAEWKPISEAPKYTYVDIWAGGRRIPNAQQQPIAFSSPIWRWWSNGSMVLEEPTHFRPLPAPPAERGKR